MAKKNYYKVSLDMKYSHEIKILANNKAKARAAAVAKFISKLKASDFNIDVQNQ